MKYLIWSSVGAMVFASAAVSFGVNGSEKTEFCKINGDTGGKIIDVIEKQEGNYLRLVCKVHLAQGQDEVTSHASCPVGKRAINGGYSITSNTGSIEYARRSFTQYFPSKNQWTSTVTIRRDGADRSVVQYEHSIYCE